MTNQPLSVVVSAGGSADDLHALLESLRPNLGLRDEVVCLVPADRPDLRREVMGQAWLRVLDEAPREPGERWAAGLAATRHDLVALLDGDLILPAQWRSPLVEQFADGTVVAAGPRCHNSFGPQGGLDLPESAMSGVAAFKAHARQWRQDHRNEVATVDRLGPVCVVVRRDALEAVGGPTADMPYGLLRERGSLVLVQSVLVAHIGGPECSLRITRPPGAPLLSASLIVKDEESVVAACVTALAKLADEVVVYDTGSTDRTREIARAEGAKVIEGYWDDHFGDARNRALAHCAGEWVFVVDADEVVTGDGDALRERLEASTAQAHLLTIRNVEDVGSHDFLAPRLFRGDRIRYAGRLHEQGVDHATGTGLNGPAIHDVTVVHSGYTVATFALKDKGDRNRRLAELAVADQVHGLDAVVNLARSQFAAEDVEGGVQTAQATLAGRDLPPRIRIALLGLVIRGCTQLERVDEARTAFEDLRTVARQPVTIANMEVHLRFVEGDHHRVLDLIADFPEAAQDDLLVTVGRSQLAGIHLQSLMHLGRTAEAADLLRGFLRQGHLPMPLDAVTAILQEAGSGLAEIAELVPLSRLRWLLHSAGRAEPQLAEALVDALYQRYPGDAKVLGFIAWMAERLPLMRALEWSARLRRHRLADRCPLLAIAREPRRSARDRVLAAAIAYETFTDAAAMPLLTEALESVTEEETGGVLEELRVVAPGIAHAVEPVGAAGTFSSSSAPVR